MFFHRKVTSIYINDYSLWFSLIDYPVAYVSPDPEINNNKKKKACWSVLENKYSVEHVSILDFSSWKVLTMLHIYFLLKKSVQKFWKKNMKKNVDLDWQKDENEFFNRKKKRIVKKIIQKKKMKTTPQLFCVAEDWMLLEGGVLYGFTRLNMHITAL